ncbi:uncharacterized protein LOC120627204 [Pararge aegeria]|uniref:uncharacterized protein LOC120627204 n=1 Tax=Pararge aegeria TaxID=116150 RepID=UPI0019D30DB1|nr:uncharacterized protein LOC120627204 [Pararge aegeria]
MKGNVIFILKLTLLDLMFCVEKSSALLCYNCSSTHRSGIVCGGEFAKSSLVFNSSRHYLLNCSGDTAMCFVRSWNARAKHAWIVQRGCYQLDSTDPFLSSMETATRAMTCKSERLVDAEYKVCLCGANWCNTTSLSWNSSQYLQVVKSIIHILSIYLLS